MGQRPLLVYAPEQLRSLCPDTYRISRNTRKILFRHGLCQPASSRARSRLPLPISPSTPSSSSAPPSDPSPKFTPSSSSAPPLNSSPKSTLTMGSALDSPSDASL